MSILHFARRSATKIVLLSMFGSMFAGAATSLSGQAALQESIPPDAPPYARYTPFPCSIVPMHIETMASVNRRLTWRERWPATAASDRADSVAAAAAHSKAVAETRACLASHPVATTPHRQLVGLGLAWRSAEDSAQASAAFRLALKNLSRAPVEERASLLAFLVETYATDPQSLPTARSYLTQLDALGTPAAGYRVSARNKLYGLAASIDSIPLMEEHAAAALQVSRTLTGDLQREWIGACAQAVVNQADLDGRRGQFDVAVAALKKAQEELGPINPTIVGQVLAPQLAKSSMYGYKMPTVDATHVFYPPGHAAGQSTGTSPALPAKGRVSLFLTADYHWFDDKLIGLYTVTDKIVKRFGADIDVVVLTETSGFNAGRIITTPNELPLFPEFFFNYLKVNIPVVVHERARPTKRDDGQLLYPRNPNDWGFMVLVDKKGGFRNVDNGSGLNNSLARWTNMIQELLREP